MADFNIAIEHLLDHEGGYVYDPMDPGGETKYGISARSYPYLVIRDLKLIDAEMIYLEDYWEPLRLREVMDQNVANKVLDLGVNFGIRGGAKLLQASVNDLLAPALVLKVDGQVGQLTLDAVKCVVPDRLLDRLQYHQALRYGRLVSAKPSLVKFLGGWLNRSEFRGV